MTPRQQKAQAINRMLREAFGDDCAVINNLPFPDDQQLRIQVIDAKCYAFIEEMCSRGWLPQFFCTQYRVSTGNYSLVPASVFEVRLEHPRQPVPQDMPRQRVVVQDDVDKRAKSPEETQQM